VAHTQGSQTINRLLPDYLNPGCGEYFEKFGLPVSSIELDVLPWIGRQFLLLKLDTGSSSAASTSRPITKTVVTLPRKWGITRSNPKQCS